MTDRARMTLHHAVRNEAVVRCGAVACGKAGRRTSSNRRMADGEAAAGRHTARETMPSTARRWPHCMKATGAHPAARMKAATAEATDMHATTAEAAATAEAARMKATTAAMKATTAAVEASAAAMEAASAAAKTTATAVKTATAATTAWRGLREVEDGKTCDGTRENCGQRHRNLSAGYSQHDFLHLQDGGRKTGNATHTKQHAKNTLRHD